MTCHNHATYMLRMTHCLVLTWPTCLTIQLPYTWQPMSKYPGKYRGPGYRHPQSTCHFGQCPNIRANTGDEDTGTHSPPATVANILVISESYESHKLQWVMVSHKTHMSHVEPISFNATMLRNFGGDPPPPGKTVQGAPSGQQQSFVDISLWYCAWAEAGWKQAEGAEPVLGGCATF